MDQDVVSRTLALLNPDDLWPAWRWIDLMERHGGMCAEEARGWKDGIHDLMVLWGLEPGDLLYPAATVQLIQRSS